MSARAAASATAVGLLDGRRDRLLAGDVLARLKRGYRLFRVQVGRRQQLDGIDVWVFEDLLIASVNPRSDAPLSRSALGTLAHRVTESDDVTRFVFQVARRIELGYGPAPNNGQPDSVLLRMAHAYRRPLRT